MPLPYRLCTHARPCPACARRARPRRPQPTPLRGRLLAGPPPAVACTTRPVRHTRVEHFSHVGSAPRAWLHLLHAQLLCLSARQTQSSAHSLVPRSSLSWNRYLACHVISDGRWRQCGRCAWYHEPGVGCNGNSCNWACSPLPPWLEAAANTPQLQCWPWRPGTAFGRWHARCRSEHSAAGAAGGRRHGQGPPAR